MLGRYSHFMCIEFLQSIPATFIGEPTVKQIEKSLHMFKEMEERYQEALNATNNDYLALLFWGIAKAKKVSLFYKGRPFNIRRRAYLQTINKFRWQLNFLWILMENLEKQQYCNLPSVQFTAHGEWCSTHTQQFEPSRYGTQRL